MAQIAIRGHEIRGKEVIRVLEMLEGKNLNNLKGKGKGWIYIIKSSYNGEIDCLNVISDEYYKVFSLEEFLEKFPYKVKDKVIYKNKRREITKMVWEEQTNTVAYKLDDKLYCNVVDELQPYKEEIMKEENNDNWAKWDLPDGYEFQDKEGRVIKTDVIKLVKKQLKYPKSYEKCCKIVGGIAPARHLQYDTTPSYKFEEDLRDSLETLRKLIICRNAYWRIYGEYMGSLKPWEPDWLNVEQDKYVIYTHNNNICSNRYVLGHNILAFPTAEMRNAFYENFKKEIEECKELL